MAQLEVRVVSDIHLEYSRNGPKYVQKLVPPESSDKIMIMAGDIGHPTSNLYKMFMKQICPYYRAVIIITGNHEYYQNKTDPYGKIKRYGLTMNQIDDEIRELAKSIPNFYFLQKDELILDRVRFLGCTLWTDPDPSLIENMNDYFLIRDMTADHCKKLHLDHKAWLESKLNEEGNFDQTVVITHHCPSPQLIGRKSKLDCFYCSELEPLVSKAEWWICGHDHGHKSTIIGGCQCIKNALGHGVRSANPFFQIQIPLYIDLSSCAQE